MKNAVSLLLLLATAGGAFAQDSGSEEIVPEIRRYTVEMIIFSYAQNVSAGSEIFVPDAPPPIDPMLLDTDMSLRSLPEVMEETVVEEEIADEPRKYELVMLAKDDFQLVDAYERLSRLDAYEPLLHFGWTEPTYPEEDTEARPLSSLVTPPEGLEGELTLYLSRYLHLAVNLQLDAPANEQSNPLTTRRDARDSYMAYGEEDVTYPVRYRIDEDRIFRNGELRYYDHPKFGVLAKITRFEEPEEDEEENGEMLGDVELAVGE